MTAASCCGGARLTLVDAVVDRGARYTKGDRSGRCATRTAPLCEARPRVAGGLVLARARARSRLESGAPRGDYDARCRRDGPDHHSLVGRAALGGSASAARRWKRSRRCADLLRPQPGSRRPWAGQRRGGPRSTRPGAGAAAPCRPRRPASRRSSGRHRTSGSAVAIAARAGARRRRAAAASRLSCRHSRPTGAGPTTALTSPTRPKTGCRERSRASAHSRDR